MAADAQTLDHIRAGMLDETFRIAREVVKSLNWNKGRPPLELLPVRAPLYDIDELAGVVPVDYRKPYDCREVIARIVDGSEFLDLKYEYDQQTICGRAAVHGHQIGILANARGVLMSEEAQKAGIPPREADDFIRRCCTEYQLPIVGLMCIPPADEHPAPHFALLGEIAKRHDLKQLSMGMSGDYELAIQMGATHVRVGTAIFGARETKA